MKLIKYIMVLVVVTQSLSAMEAKCKKELVKQLNFKYTVNSVTHPRDYERLMQEERLVKQLKERLKRNIKRSTQNKNFCISI